MEIYEKTIYKIASLIIGKEYNQANLYCQNLLKQGIQTQQILLLYTQTIKQLKSIDDALYYLENKYQQLKSINNLQSFLLLLNLAKLNEEKNNYSKSILHYQTVITNFDVTDQRIYFNIAFCYQQLKNQTEALKYYETCLSINPQFQPAVLNISVIRYKSKEMSVWLNSVEECNRKKDAIINNMFVFEHIIDQKELYSNLWEQTSDKNLLLKINQSVYISKKISIEESLKLLFTLQQKFKKQKKKQQNLKIKYILTLYIALHLNELGRNKQSLQYFKQIYLFQNSPHRKYAKQMISKIRGSNSIIAPRHLLHNSKSYGAQKNRVM